MTCRKNCSKSVSRARSIITSTGSHAPLGGHLGHRGVGRQRPVEDRGASRSRACGPRRRWPGRSRRRGRRRRACARRAGSRRARACSSSGWARTSCHSGRASKGSRVLNDSSTMNSAAVGLAEHAAARGRRRGRSARAGLASRGRPGVADSTPNVKGTPVSTARSRRRPKNSAALLGVAGPGRRLLGDLEHAGAEVAHDADQRGDLVPVGEAGGDRAVVGGLVVGACARW